eukprot:430147_1
MPATTDITIIGAGASGSSTMYHLIKYLNQKNPNKKTSILLLDSRGASGGATGRNGGGLGVSGSGTFTSTLSKHGEKAAFDRYNFTLQTVNFVTNYISSHSDIKDTIQTGYSMGPLNYTDIPATESSMKIFQSYIGNASMNESILSHQKTEQYAHTYQWEASTYDGNGSFFWPAKVVFGLINDSILMSNNSMNIDENNAVNLNIQFETSVDSVFKNADNKWEIVTTNKDMIISSIVIFATNGYTSYLLPEYSERIIPAKNQVIMSKPWSYFIWNDVSSGFGDDFEYWTQRIQDNKILIGGGRNAVSDNENKWIGNYNDSYIDKNVSNYLQNYLSTLYPEISNSTNGKIQIQIEWQGIMGFSNDYLPWIGPLTNNTNENGYICAGFTGGGMDYTWGGGKAIAQMIVGMNVDNFVDIFLPYYPGRK